MKRGKQSYFTKYFKRNLKNIKNTWKEIKIITSMRSSSSITPTLVTFQNKTIDYPVKIAIIFNNFFSTIGEKTLAKIKYLYKGYTAYLTNENRKFFSLLPTGKEEINLILSSPDISKTTVP